MLIESTINRHQLEVGIIKRVTHLSNIHLLIHTLLYIYISLVADQAGPTISFKGPLKLSNITTRV